MASSTIQNVSSCPDYINAFIKHNYDKLMEIYGEGYLNNLSRVAQASEDALTLIRSNVYSPFLKSVYRLFF